MTKEEVYLSRSLFTRIFPTHSTLGITPEEYYETFEDYLKSLKDDKQPM